MQCPCLLVVPTLLQLLLLAAACECSGWWHMCSNAVCVATRLQWHTLLLAAPCVFPARHWQAEARYAAEL